MLKIINHKQQKTISYSFQLGLSLLNGFFFHLLCYLLKISGKQKIIRKYCQTQDEFYQAAALLVSSLRQEDYIKEQDKQNGFIQSHKVDQLKNFWEKKDISIIKRGDKVLSFIVARKSQQSEKYKNNPLDYAFMQMLEQLKYKGKNISQYKYVLLGRSVVSKQQRFKGVVVHYALRDVVFKGYDLIVYVILDNNFESLNTFHKQGVRIIAKIERDRYIVVGELNVIIDKIVAKL